MIDDFYMNGYHWHVKMVDPNSPELVDRTGLRTVATTNPETKTLCLSMELYGPFFTTVLIHELGHCTMISFGLIEEIHRMVKPEYWVDAEEFMCNFIADYGMMIFRIAYQLFGEKGLMFVPSEIERMMAA